MASKSISGSNYLIHDDGRVQHSETGTVLKPWLAGGRFTVGFQRDGKRIDCKIHLLVLLAFVGPPGKNQVAMHLDADPTNNRLSNLKWGTRKENQQQMFLDEHAHWQKLTAEQVREIRRRKEAGETYKELAEAFGMNSITSIYNICKRITWGWLK
jgi:hypothetical protein